MSAILNQFREKYQQALGEDGMDAIEIISDLLLAHKTVSYSMVKTPEICRLGILSYFAILAITLPGETELKGVISTTKPAYYLQYLEDRYGKSGISAEIYMKTFGVSLKEYESKTMTELLKMELYQRDHNNEKVLYLCDGLLFQGLYASLNRIAQDVIPVVEDDGLCATQKFMSSRRAPI